MTIPQSLQPSKAGTRYAKLLSPTQTRSTLVPVLSYAHVNVPNVIHQQYHYTLYQALTIIWVSILSHQALSRWQTTLIDPICGPGCSQFPIPPHSFLTVITLLWLEHRSSVQILTVSTHLLASIQPPTPTSHTQPERKVLTITPFTSSRDLCTRGTPSRHNCTPIQVNQKIMVA